MKPRILIYTAMYNRPLVSELFCMSMQRVIEQQKHQYDFMVYAAVSGQESIDVCHRYYIPHLVAPNVPLGKKWNDGLRSALDNYNWDYVMIMGDDDIMDAKLLSLYLPKVRKGDHYFGVNELYFYSPGQAQAVHFQYKNKTAKLIGCCRMISRRAVEHTGWKIPVQILKDQQFLGVNLRARQTYVLPEEQAEYLTAMDYARITGDRRFALWENGLGNSLDNYSEMSLLLNGYTPTLVTTARPMITDVKTTQNIWQFNHYFHLSRPASIEQATSFFTPEEKRFAEDLAWKKIA